MRKKLLLGLFLMIAGISTSRAQDIAITDNGTSTVLKNTTTSFLLDNSIPLVLLRTYTLELISAPAGSTDSYSDTAFTLASLLSIVDLSSSFDDFTPTAIGDYVFKLTGPTGALSSGELAQFTVKSVATLGIENLENTPEFSVFSKDGVLNIANVDEHAVTGMSVYSLSGSQIYKSNKAVSSIDLSSVADGVYVLLVQEGAASKTKKFIKH